MSKRNFETLKKSDVNKKETKFTRNFDHVDGNWPSYVYLYGNYRRLGKISDLCLNHFYGSSHTSSSVICETAPHVSLSRPFVLRHHQILSFLDQLSNAIQSLNRFSVHVFSEYKLLLNDSKTRLFVAIPIEDHNSKIQQIITSVDSVLQLFLQPMYYEDPIYHISIASLPVTTSSSETISSHTNNVSTVVTVSESYPIKKKYSNFNKFRSYDCDQQDSCTSSDDDDDDSNGDSDSDCIQDSVSDHNQSGVATETGLYETALLDNSGDSLGAVMTFRGVECKIGNRIFRLPFTKLTSATGKNSFVEIK